jgi:hypothetical protein
LAPGGLLSGSFVGRSGPRLYPKRTLSDMNDQQFGDKEMQIVRAAFQDAAAATGRLHAGVWDLAAINESITKSGIAMGTLNAVLRLRDLDPTEWEARLTPDTTDVTIRRKAQYGKRS